MVARIKALMRQQGMTDADLARKTGISPATLSRVLSLSTEDPRISTLTAIAEALRSGDMDESGVPQSVHPAVF